MKTGPVVSQVLSQVRCLEKVKLAPLAPVVSQWAEEEAGSPDHLALEGTAFLVLLDLEDHHHTSLVGLITIIYAIRVKDR